MKHVTVIASVVALLAIPALAQTTSPTPPSAARSESPAATGPATPPPSSAKPDSGAASRGAVTTTAGWRMSQLLGQKILNSARDNVGDVNDVILDRSGKVSKVVVGVGGFLGIGEKNVALDFDKLAISQGTGNQLSVMVAETKEALLAAPEWVDPNAAMPTMTK